MHSVIAPTLESLSEPQEIVRNGKPLTVRRGRAKPEFWKLWRSRRPELKQYGVMLNKFGKIWEVTIPDQALSPGEYKKPEPRADIDPTAKLKEYQYEDTARLVDFHRDGQRWTLNASGTGSGKTFMACVLAKELGLPIFVICPKSVISYWRAVAKYCGTGVRAITNYESLKRDNPVVKWETTAKGQKWPIWKRPVFNSLHIYDEAHRCKAHSPLTMNAKLLIASVRQGQVGHILSATLADSPLDLRAAGFALGLHEFKNFYQWCYELGCRENVKSGNGREFTKWEFNHSPEVIHNLHCRLFSTCAVRIDSEILAKNMPENDVQAEAYDIGPEVEKVYARVEKEITALKRKTAKYKTDARSLVIAARQEIEIIKVPAVVGMAQDALEEGNSVVIFANFAATLEALASRLKCREIISGQHGERDEVVKRFRNDQTRLIICNINAAGESISLHGKRPRFVILFPTWSAITFKQALGRAHRQGGSRAVQRIVYAKDSVEEKICHAVKGKLQRINLLNDGDMGEPFTI